MKEMGGFERVLIADIFVSLFVCFRFYHVRIKRRWSNDDDDILDGQDKGEVKTVRTHTHNLRNKSTWISITNVLIETLMGGKERVADSWTLETISPPRAEIAIKYNKIEHKYETRFFFVSTIIFISLFYFLTNFFFSFSLGLFVLLLDFPSFYCHLWNWHTLNLCAMNVSEWASVRMSILIKRKMIGKQIGCV